MKLKKTLFSDKLGAMYVVRNTSDSECYVFPASMGIQKHEGCVEFKVAEKYETTGYNGWTNRKYRTRLAVCTACGFGMMMKKQDMLRVYFDCPENEEAWLVYPKGQSYVWERVDHLLELIK